MQRITRHNFSVAFTILAVAACTDARAPTGPLNTAAPRASVSADDNGKHVFVFTGDDAPADFEVRVSVCHATGTGNYLLLVINEHAVAGHRSHGDALPGELVPGMAGYQFDANCVPKSIATDLTGEWAGTYAWDCGVRQGPRKRGGTLTGSTAIRFLLTDPGSAPPRSSTVGQLRRSANCQAASAKRRAALLLSDKIPPPTAKPDDTSARPNNGECMRCSGSKPAMSPAAVSATKECASWPVPASIAFNHAVR